jgi:hypothetical protein
MELNINAYQKAIEVMLSLGHTILQVFPLNDTTAYYFAVHQFNPSMTTPTDDIQFNQVVGINITDFVRNNVLVDRNSFVFKFEQLISDPNTDVVRMEFPNTVRWFKFAPAR